MSPAPPIPRVFLLRHGETAWSLSGRHTGATDIPLTPAGESRVRATARALVGPDRLIVPGNVAAVFVSPRTRAQRTLQLFVEEGLQGVQGRTETREEVREWEYGEYEGITSGEIQEQRAREGLGRWEIWRDGCPGGEGPEEVARRCDGVIREIRERFHGPALGHRERKGCPASDVVVVAHGHVLRSLAARWVGRRLEDNPALLLEAGGVGTLSYEHHSIHEPAIVLGGAFVVDVEEGK